MGKAFETTPSYRTVIMVNSFGGQPIFSNSLNTPTDKVEGLGQSDEGNVEWHLQFAEPRGTLALPAFAVCSG